eukprot:6019585-Amphidinium_carterae.1
MRAIANAVSMSFTVHCYLMGNGCHGLVDKYYNEESGSFSDTHVEDSSDEAKQQLGRETSNVSIKGKATEYKMCRDNGMGRKDCLAHPCTDVQLPLLPFC